jgi:outer membrane protein OmpA-like peptidoglycan-associated protein
MNTSATPKKTLIAAAIAAALLAACTAAPVKPDAAAGLRTRLNQLESNADVASRVPLAIKEADTAVTAAEQPQTDATLTQHLVFIADRKIDLAKALGESRLAVDQRKALGEQREAMRLQARTQEADSANQRAATAQADAIDQKQQANTARDAAANAQRDSQELQRQIDELHAKSTERGLVLTLGDVLFATNASELNAGGATNLAKLASFLNKYPARTAVIEGYTDSIGSENYNQNLSQRRADSVRSYLVNHGIDSTRLTASGKGKSAPIGDNSSSTGRQQNRRVEVIIESDRVS